MNHIIDEKRLEYEGLKAFRDSINGELKEYLKPSIAGLMKRPAEIDDDIYSMDERVAMLSDIISDLLEWRIQYEKERKYIEVMRS
jgi:uncharacterized Fe-S cluster-containing protein